MWRVNYKVHCNIFFQFLQFHIEGKISLSHRLFKYFLSSNSEMNNSLKLLKMITKCFICNLSTYLVCILPTLFQNAYMTSATNHFLVRVAITRVT